MKYFFLACLFLFFSSVGICFSGELTVRVPVDDYPPFFIKTETGQWRGLSIELAEALARIRERYAIP